MMRLVRVLLRLYPEPIRAAYEADWCARFARRSAAAGGPARIGVLLAAAAMVVRGALAAHWSLLVQDVRFGARSLSRAPGFTLAAVAVIAVGVGANTAAFSVADFVLLRPLPFPEPDSLVRLCEGPRTGGGWGCMNELSPANYRDFATMTSSFEAVGAYAYDAVNLVGAGNPERVAIARMTSEVLPLLGVPPRLGRAFDAGDGGRDQQVVVLSHRLFQSRFGGDPGVLGRVVSFDGTPHEVIGVMPPAFHFPNRDVGAWTPLALREEDFADRGNSYLHGVARLGNGVTMERAHADLAAVAERLAREHPETNEETGISFFRLRDEQSPRYRALLVALCGASLCLLLLACANLSNLLLVRAAVRQRELALRATLGASRRRLVRQLVTESMVLALLGGLAGVAVAAWSVPLLTRLVPETLPLAPLATLDPRVIALAAGSTALTGLAFGVLPALRAGGRSGAGLRRDAARAGGGRTERVRNVLVAVEIAISVVLLMSCGLLIRAVWRVQAIDPGFAPEDVVTLETALPSPRYDDPVPRGEFYRRVLTEVRGLPGVRAASYVSGLPMVMTGGIGLPVFPGQERPSWHDTVSIRFAMPELFDALGVPLVTGRDFGEGDAADGPRVAVVSRSFVERHWPTAPPVGRTFTLWGEERTVVGVVGDVKMRGLERSSEPQVYLPAFQAPEGDLGIYGPKVLVIRSAGAGAALLPAVREIVRAVDSEQPISEVRTLVDVVAGQTAVRRAHLRVLSALAAVALALSAIGVYGLLAYAVSLRSREIGVRLALGAEPAAVARSILRQGMTLTLAGALPGVLLAYAAARWMSSLLFGVEPGDPLTYAVTVGTVLAIAALGSSVPALRAVRVSPMAALRTD